MSTAAENNKATVVTEEPEKLDLRSIDIVAESRAELMRLFPEVRTDDGKIDFERLKLALGETVDVGKERYGMNWPGKADCFRTIQTPSVGTLRPAPEESVNFDTTENLIIEGDNLEVLKLLQKSYLGKMKMIYIDPPYNTGNDFIYPDNYKESLETYLEYTGQVDVEGKKFGTNTEADGRFHTKWLNMMYPRLFLARNLLREDGIIFVSIDDGEYENLHRTLSELFGEDNFLATFIWKRKAGGGDDSGHVAAEHEYILCFARDSSKAAIASVLHESPSMTAKYNRSENGRRFYLERLDKTSLTYNPSMDFPIEAPDGTQVKPPQPDPANPTTSWRWGKKTVIERRDELIFEKDKKTGDWRIYTRTWEPTEGVTPRSLMVENHHGRNRDGTQELDELIGPKIFSNPKPTRMLLHLLNIGAKEKDALVLDFFAGSGSTADAVLKMNVEDGGNRKFILVQLPEPTERTDFPTITSITRERVRKAIEKTSNEANAKLKFGEEGPEFGFKAFSLSESNFTAWDAEGAKDAVALSHQLGLHIDHIRQHRTDDDILYELLLKSGFPLTTPVEKRTVAEKTVYSVASGALVICLDRALTLELIRAIANMKPERVVCLDEGFAGNDQLKTNAVQTFKTKGITSFKTV